MGFMKRVLATAVLFSTFALSASAPINADRYALDGSHTHIGFSVRHLGISNVKGKFNKFEGEIVLDEADISRSSVRVKIDPASIDTNNDRRDSDLRGEEFFDVAKFPAATFVSKRVEKKGPDLQVTGDLTIRDVTREVVIPFTMSGPLKSANGQKRMGAEGTLVINRFDYGLKWNRMTEAVAVVAPEVRIELSIEAATPRPATVD